MSKQNYNRFIQALRLFNSPERMDHEIGHDELKSFMEEKSKNLEEKVFTDKEIRDIKSESSRYANYIQMIIEEMIDEYADEGGYYTLGSHVVQFKSYIHKDFVRCMGDKQFSELIKTSIMDYPSLEECVTEPTILGRDINLDLCHEQLLSKWMIERSKGPICTLLALLDATENPKEMTHLLTKKILEIETEDYLDVNASYDMNSGWYEKYVSDQVKDILINNLLNQLDVKTINSLLEYRQRIKIPYTPSLVNVIFSNLTNQQLYNYIIPVSEKIKVITNYIKSPRTKFLNSENKHPIYNQLKLLHDVKNVSADVYNSEYTELKTLISRDSNLEISKQESKLIRDLPIEITQPLEDIITEEVLNTDFNDSNFHCYVDTNNININTSIFSSLKQSEISELINKLILSYDQIENNKEFIEYSKREDVILQDIEHELDRLIANKSTGPALYLSIVLQKSHNPQKSLNDLFKRINQVEEVFYYKDYCLATVAPELKNIESINLFTEAYLDNIPTDKLIKFFDDFGLGTEKAITPLEYIFTWISDKALIDYAAQTLNVETALLITQYMHKKGVTEKTAAEQENKLTFGQQ